ncbi:hypothetical protein DUI87_18442 [Hirundo rustica rustica]|uniref:Uncharacterized protein n=1 Tax=Hirundo rustica rustica TaxID=333673 RepID=A0A3M0KDI6_HIRRU|nr:hypothetical protein DUI87_18442 [Hirundo rustica rustica]
MAKLCQLWLLGSKAGTMLAIAFTAASHLGTLHGKFKDFKTLDLKLSPVVQVTLPSKLEPSTSCYASSAAALPAASKPPMCSVKLQCSISHDDLPEASQNESMENSNPSRAVLCQLIPVGDLYTRTSTEITKPKPPLAYLHATDHDREEISVWHSSSPHKETVLHIFIALLYTLCSSFISFFYVAVPKTFTRYLRFGNEHSIGVCISRVYRLKLQRYNSLPMEIETKENKNNSGFMT